MLLKNTILAAGVAMMAMTVGAQGPTETLVIVNGESMDSITLARRFQALHGIPDRNVVRIDGGAWMQEPPEQKLQATVTGQKPNATATAAKAQLGISPEQFETLIWEPVQAKIKQRGIKGEILAWAYSCDFPVRVTTPEKQWVSLTGMTFIHGKLPTPEQIKAGRTVSPYYAGPTPDNAMALSSRSMDRLRQSGGRNPPIPSMMLGYTGERGNTLDEALRSMERGASAGREHAPTGTVYFVYNEDIRSKARHWEYPGARNELLTMGISCALTNAMPQNAVIAGLLSGHRQAKPGPTNTYQPGAFADHLTSFAAVFDQASHSKLSTWIKAGTTASAGPVVEPYANWGKFPHARTFAHQARGCTMLESLTQGIRCPLQILLVGDPLSAPYAPRVSLDVTGMPETGNATDRHFATHAFPFFGCQSINQGGAIVDEQ